MFGTYKTKCNPKWRKKRTHKTELEKNYIFTANNIVNGKQRKGKDGGRAKSVKKVFRSMIRSRFVHWILDIKCIIRSTHTGWYMPSPISIALSFLEVFNPFAVLRMRCKHHKTLWVRVYHHRQHKISKDFYFQCFSWRQSPWNFIYSTSSFTFRFCRFVDGVFVISNTWLLQAKW